MILPLYITSFFIASSIFQSHFKVKKHGFKQLSSKHSSKSPLSSTFVEIVEPGIVILRNYLTEPEQKTMSKGINQWRSMSGTESDGKNFAALNENSHDTITNFPKWAANHACTACSISRKVDPSLPKMNNKNMSLNLYKISASGHVSRRNMYEIDDDMNYPVANICVGASCRFRIVSKGGVTREVIVRSGDVLLYTGGKNSIKHALVGVISDDCPDWMNSPTSIKYEQISQNDYLLTKLREEHVERRNMNMAFIGKKRKRSMMA